MATVFLLCGLPGSGKSTLARQLEIEHRALTLNLDAWMVPLFGHQMPREVFDARLEQIKALQWALTEALLKLGLNVVLDWGFWTRAEREQARRKGEVMGAEVRLIFLNVPADELWRRVEARPLDGSTFELNREALDFFLTLFEPPTPEEGAISF